MGIFEEVSTFFESYRGEKYIYGHSEEGRPLYAIRVGRGETVGISQYSIHAREWVTALLGVEHIRRGVRKGSVWFLPCTNPDGVLLATEGVQTVSAPTRDFLEKCNICGDFSLWKANAKGVDLNVNFPAKWGKGAENRFTAGPESYVGEFPLCAKESKALHDFTLKVQPRFTVSWHTKGEEIYWSFHQPPLRRARDKKIALMLQKTTGYPLRDAPNSVGGYKDWCIETLKIPAFTVEVGRSDLSHPLGRDSLGEIIQKNIDAVARLTEVI